MTFALQPLILLNFYNMSVNPPYTLIERQSDLDQMVKLLDGVSECCLDTEADSMHHYAQKLCLIQLTILERNFIVDPLAGLDMRGFWASPGLRNLVLHGADYDLRMMFQGFGFVPDKVFDTMIAAKFLGEERIGLTHLVEKRFGHVLSKANQKADWTIRPLPEDMKQYAILDTYFLADLKCHLSERLAAEGKLEWVEETCAHIIAQSQVTPEPEEDDEPWRIKGSVKLHPDELVFVKALWEWREEQAERLDRPPFKVLGAEQMIDLAIECAYITPDIRPERLPRLPRNFTGERLDSFLRKLHSAAQIPEEQWPPREKRTRSRAPSPDSNRLEHFRKVRDDLAAKYNIDPTLLANRHALVALAMNGPVAERRHNARCLNWQWNLLAPALELV